MDSTDITSYIHGGFSRNPVYLCDTLPYIIICACIIITLITWFLLRCDSDCADIRIDELPDFATRKKNRKSRATTI